MVTAVSWSCCLRRGAGRPVDPGNGAAGWVMAALRADHAGRPDMRRLDAVPVETGLVAAAEYLQRTVLADGVRPVEDPVLPCAQAAEDAGLHGLRRAEAQVGFEAGQRIGRQARAFLHGNADLVFPVDV